MRIVMYSALVVLCTLGCARSTTNDTDAHIPFASGCMMGGDQIHMDTADTADTADTDTDVGTGSSPAAPAQD